MYTHIKTKHNNDKISFRIIDSTKGELENNRAFRLEYIKYPVKEANLMTLADKTTVKIANAIKERKLKTENYLLDDGYLSDSDIETDLHLEIEEKIEEFFKKEDKS